MFKNVIHILIFNHFCATLKDQISGDGFTNSEKVPRESISGGDQVNWWCFASNMNF